MLAVSKKSLDSKQRLQQRWRPYVRAQGDIYERRPPTSKCLYLACMACVSSNVNCLRLFLILKGPSAPNQSKCLRYSQKCALDYVQLFSLIRNSQGSPHLEYRVKRAFFVSFRFVPSRFLGWFLYSICDSCGSFCFLFQQHRLIQAHLFLFSHFFVFCS